MSKALRVSGGAEAAETAKFIEMVDKLFDCLNVSSSKGRKPFLQPYRSSNDFRLKVNILFDIYVLFMLSTQQFLRDELIPYFKKWKISAKSRMAFQKKPLI